MLVVDEAFFAFITASHLHELDRNLNIFSLLSRWRESFLSWLPPPRVKFLFWFFRRPHERRELPLLIFGFYGTECVNFLLPS